MNKGAVDPEL